MDLIFKSIFFFFFLLFRLFFFLNGEGPENRSIRHRHDNRKKYSKVSIFINAILKNEVNNEKNIHTMAID